MEYLDRLAESLYLAPQLQKSDVKKALRQVGLDFPLLMVVGKADGTQHSVESHKRGKRFFWSPHPGLVYVLWNKTSAKHDRRAFADQLFGEVFECVAPERFASVLLNAVVSFRRRELQDVLARQPQDLSFAAELDARRLALKKIELALMNKTVLAQSEWSFALELWLDIVLLRHQKHLHTVRRKLHEFLGLLTYELDHNNPLGNRFYQAQRFVLETYSLAELRNGFSVWLTEVLEEFPGQGEWRSEALSPFCKQAVEWMTGHYHEPVSVADCAAAIHLNPSYLSRLFKQETGQSPVHFLQKLRIDHARSLLQQHRHNMQEIARQCGFGSVEHFHRVFVRQVGMTPARYRRNTRPG